MGEKANAFGMGERERLFLGMSAHAWDDWFYINSRSKGDVIYP